MRFWDVASGKEVRTLSWKGAAVLDCVLTTDGKHLVVRTAGAAMEDVLRLCDAQDGKEIRTFTNKNSTDPDDNWASVAGRLALAPDNRRLAATDCGRVIRIWDIGSGNIFRSFTVEKCNVISIAYSPDGRHLIAGTAARMVANGSNGPPPPLANTVRIWDIESGRQVLLLRNRSRAFIVSVAYSADGRMFAFASADGTIRVWEVASGKEVVHRSDDSKEPLCLAFSPDCSTLAAGMQDGSILLWNITAPNEALRQKATQEELNKQWTDLASDDAARAFHSIWSFAATPQDTINFLSGRLHCIFAQTSEHIKLVISNLDNDDFARREVASKQLAAFGAQAEPALRKALAETQSAEVRSRIQPLLKALGEWVVTDPDTLRSLRAIWVLERIGTPAARAVLENLAKGAPEARQTQEAKAALNFLDKRAAAVKPQPTGSP